MIRGENVYTGRFPFKMCLYANDIAFSHFSLNVVPWYPTGSKTIVSVSDIAISYARGKGKDSARKFVTCRLVLRI